MARKTTQPEVEEQNVQGTSFADINELTEEFIQNSTKHPLKYDDNRERSLETILEEQLFTIKYNMRMRNLIVSKLVPLLSDKTERGEQVLQQRKDIVRLSELFELIRKNSQETNNVQKAISSFSVGISTSDEQ